MTPAELRELLAAATPGPWVVAPLAHSKAGWDVCEVRAVEQGVELWRVAYTAPSQEADAALIAALRNSAPALLDRVEALERALAEAVVLLREDAVEHHRPGGWEKAAKWNESKADEWSALLRDGEGSR